MKKLIVIFLVLVIALLVWAGESRKFICLDNGKCITVWKTFGDVCYIIPGKYYGLLRPSKGHIKTTNGALIELYFINSSPDMIIYRSTNRVEVKSIQSRESIFQDFMADRDKYRKLLFEDEKTNKLNDNVDYIFIDVRDSRSVDKYQNQLW